MAKISDVVNLKTGYANYVELKSAFEETRENAARMAMCHPRCLAEWEQKGEKGGIRNFYQDFGKVLEAITPGLSVTQLRSGLKNYDSEALENFRSAFEFSILLITWVFYIDVSTSTIVVSFSITSNHFTNNAWGKPNLSR